MGGEGVDTLQIKYFMLRNEPSPAQTCLLNLGTEFSKYYTARKLQALYKIYSSNIQCMYKALQFIHWSWYTRLKDLVSKGGDGIGSWH